MIPEKRATLALSTATFRESALESDAMIEIPISKGYVVLVDDCDADLALHKWSALEVNQNTKKVYAYRTVRKNKVRKTVLMHRVIMERVYGVLAKGITVDHKKSDGLENTRNNLRLATKQEQCMNSRKKRSNAKYKGVVHGSPTTWYACIYVDKKSIYLGNYDTEEMAAIAYNYGALKHYGEFANFNDVLKWRDIVPIARPRKK